jgi:hypothetical protein
MLVDWVCGQSAHVAALRLNRSRRVATASHRERRRADAEHAIASVAQESSRRGGSDDSCWAIASAAAVVRIVGWTQTGLDRQQAVGHLPIFH